MAISRLILALPAALLLIAGAVEARAETTAKAAYVVNLGGTIIANAEFTLTDAGSTYSLSLNAKISGLAQLIASGIARVDSTGTIAGGALHAQTSDLLTRSGGEDFTVKVRYAGGEVTSFVVNPAIVNNIDRVPVERSQLKGVNDFISSFVLKADKLDKSLCSQKAQIFTGIERFDLVFSYAKDDVATSPRTGYQGPVVLCKIDYRPISGHYTTSEITNSLAQDDRILIWYAPLRDTGYYIPYRVLLSTSMGDFSMVLTKLG